MDMYTKNKYSSSFWKLLEKRIPNSIPYFGIRESKKLVGNLHSEYFFSRFLCGGEALKDYRKISRVRIELARIGATKTDFPAIQLSQQIYEFNKSVLQISEFADLNHSVLKSLHFSLSKGTSNPGEYTKKQNWIGPSFENSTYIGPSANSLNLELNEFFNFYNSKIEPNYYIILFVYCWLVSIHPFNDGNGRTARAIYCGLFKKYKSTLPPIFLYFLSRDRTVFKNAIQEFNDKSKDPLSNNIWSESIDWSKLFEEKYYSTLGQLDRQFNNRILMLNIDILDKEILSRLIKEPVLTVSYLAQSVNFPHNLISSSCEKFSELGIFQRYKSKEDTNEIIYVCNEVIETWNYLGKLRISPAI